jgi:hypothetical protein
MIRMFFRRVLRHGVPPISREEESSNIVSKPNRSQSRCALTLGPRCLDEQPLQPSAVLCHTPRLHLFCYWLFHLLLR